MSLEPIKPIAITGGISTGKSTICRLISEFGHEVGSADEIAKAIFDQPDTQEDLRQLFGSKGAVTREFVKHQISLSPEIRRNLNKIMHRKILREFCDSQYEFIEVPLLVETCILDFFSQIWLAWCDKKTQFERVARNLGNDDDAVRWIRTQLPLEAKVPFADAIIRTNCELDTVRRHVANLLRVDCA